jgi:WD40 repeat protein
MFKRGSVYSVWTVAFSATGDCLASGSLNQMVRVWTVQTGTRCNTI